MLNSTSGPLSGADRNSTTNTRTSSRACYSSSTATTSLLLLPNESQRFSDNYPCPSGGSRCHTRFKRSNHSAAVQSTTCSSLQHLRIDNSDPDDNCGSWLIYG
ncbi:unnamed protein product [Nippostrongylus brasiliensis]|uniref:Uncharacterized protein n=1 Tax=Nippostrongylus brasiliensis TaxID=27835 RepID=A0A0N4XPK8_NIPBR|nr:unnamed protein product [Nippostrongylus brasiliensis]